MVGEGLTSDFTVEVVGYAPTSKTTEEERRILALAQQRAVPIKEMTSKELGLVASTVHAQGIIAVMRRKVQNLSEVSVDSMNLAVILDAVSDPGNLGSILRTSDWFGVDVVLLGKECASAYNEKVVRSTAGSLFHLRVVEEVDVVESIRLLRKGGFRVWATATKGTSVGRIQAGSAKVALVMGNEARGLSDAVLSEADEVVSIPRVGKAESLNVAVACGIVLSYIRAAE